MTVRIEAGKIFSSTGTDVYAFKRRITVVEGNVNIINKYIYARIREELEVIDYENFMKE